MWRVGRIWVAYLECSVGDVGSIGFWDFIITCYSQPFRPPSIVIPQQLNIDASFQFIHSYTKFISHFPPFLNNNNIIIISQSMSSLQITTPLMQSLKPAKIIKQHTSDITGLDFSNDGEILYVSDSQTLNVYLTANAQCYRKLFMKNYQIEQLSHTHNNNAIIVATKKNHMVLYWSIHENKIIKMFKGHTDSITNLVINPKDDYFLTTANDSTLRIWNLNSKHQQCQFKLNVDSESMSNYPVANFDPTGVCFGVAWSVQQKDKQVVRICLYGLADCETGPFADWRKDLNEVKVMKFSNNGEVIILATADNSIVLLDAFEGNQIHKFTNFLNESSIIQCSFTPNSKFVLSGSENGLVHVWNTEGEEVAKLASHIEKVSFVKFSPKHCLMASAGRNVALWLPDTKQLRGK